MGRAGSTDFLFLGRGAINAALLEQILLKLAEALGGVVLGLGAGKFRVTGGAGRVEPP
jgi:hypothetical protein